uniref:Serpentine receptor class gamma n=1 Tax=Panagrellus redivivus TaxID=6233 RepID=A0A7E4VSS3_PANRE
MPLWNFYNAHPWVLNCVMMAKGTAFYSYQLFDCLLAFNRLTAVCMITRYGMFWNDHFNKFILFVVGGAVVLCWNTPFVTFKLIPSEEYNVKMIIDGIAEVLLQDKGVSYVTFPIVIVAMLFNLTTLACIWKRRGKTPKKKLLNDLKLLLLSLVSTTAQLVVSLLFLDEVQKYITIDYTSRFVILDVILCLQPWLFLALEKNVQKKLGELFCCTGNSKVKVYHSNDGCLHPPSRVPQTIPNSNKTVYFKLFH